MLGQRWCLCGLPLPSRGETERNCRLAGVVSPYRCLFRACKQWPRTHTCNLAFLLSWLVGENTKEDLQGKKSLSEKVSLYRGDITLLEVDAIVNAGRWLNILCSCVLKILYSSMVQVWTLKSCLKLVSPVEICWKCGVFSPVHSYCICLSWVHLL